MRKGEEDRRAKQCVRQMQGQNRITVREPESRQKGPGTGSGRPRVARPGARPQKFPCTSSWESCGPSALPQLRMAF